ncbi:type I 3-dehydroquinate dehydratase [Georgenia subflava]|uniref:3-dehydroquinate dehydratase n=1 Tax=Georgenia subflava TaxID=1622177 RepID=A0A6N7ELF5_9MICO|nr:type I 3-dehydroquinate dehydratase [Georgenia subflava]MPV38890.1 type I 3-dehydroquinate dehydratase [Georgenia subflava]
MATLTVQGVPLGEGRPKVVVPLTARGPADLVAAAEHLAGLDRGPDLVEWRADHFDRLDDVAAVVAAARSIGAVLGGTPLLFTIRTAAEGGATEIDGDHYLTVNSAVVEAGAAHLLDVELRTAEPGRRDLVSAAHARGVAVVVSSHDFEGTPDRATLLDRLRRMRDLGADLPKIAVMPRSPADLLNLLDVTWTFRQESERPLVTMAMGATGVVSRLAGGVFGSACTFAFVGAASAPGQVPLAELHQVLDVVHGDDRTDHAEHHGAERA